MFGSFLTIFFALAIVRAADENLSKKNELTDTVEEEVDMVMSEVKQHCHALNHDSGDVRKKREVGGDDVRSIIQQLLRRCSSRGSVDINPTVAPVSSEGPCTSARTVNLTGSWRKDNRGSHLRPDHGMYACDKNLQRDVTWFRFTGSAGAQLSNKCAPQYSCGSHGGFWSNAPMPTRVGEIKRVPIYGSFQQNCQWYTWPIPNALTVQRCSSRPGDFVYKVRGTGSCSWTFCGMDLAN